MVIKTKNRFRNLIFFITLIETKYCWFKNNKRVENYNSIVLFIFIFLVGHSFIQFINIL